MIAKHAKYPFFSVLTMEPRFRLHSDELSLILKSLIETLLFRK